MSDYNIPTPEERRRRREEESGDAMKPNHIMRTIFGIIMVIVYVGMGVLPVSYQHLTLPTILRVSA